MLLHNSSQIKNLANYHTLISSDIEFYGMQAMAQKFKAKLKSIFWSTYSLFSHYSSPYFWIQILQPKDS